MEPYTMYTTYINTSSSTTTATPYTWGNVINQMFDNYIPNVSIKEKEKNKKVDFKLPEGLFDYE